MTAPMDEFSPLTIAGYASLASSTDQRSDGGSLAFPLLGLFGETGSLLSEVKRSNVIGPRISDTPAPSSKNSAMSSGT